MYEHQTQIAFTTLALYCMALSFAIQRGKGFVAMVWILGILTVGSMALVIAGPFFSPTHSASFGSSYLMLGSTFGAMGTALGKLHRGRSQSA
jgi:hypothetical protein